VSAWTADDVSRWVRKQGIPAVDASVLRSEEISGDVLLLAASILAAAGFVVAKVRSPDVEWIEPLVAKLSLGGRVKFMRALALISV
jgi:hypothetical protein